MMNDDEHAPIGGMIKRNESTRRKPAPVPLCSPQVPHDLTQVRTQATAVEIQLVTFIIKRVDL
jgi:hypothetical protein